MAAATCTVWARDTKPCWIRREPPVKGYSPSALAASCSASCASFQTLAAAWASSANTSAARASRASKPQPQAAALALPTSTATALTSRKPGRDMRHTMRQDKAASGASVVPGSGGDSGGMRRW